MENGNRNQNRNDKNNKHNDNNQNSMVALMHNMGEVEYLGTWGRCWFDLGTSDAIALDILINSLQTLCKEYLELDRLIIGGENEDWPIEEDDQPGLFYEVDDEADEE